jgi:hypothetical protein
MQPDKELAQIVESMVGIKGRFVQTEKLYSAPHEDEVAFEGLLTEAKVIIGQSLGLMNEFRQKLSQIEIAMKTSFHGGPSYHDVCTAIATVEGAVRHIGRLARTPSSDVQPLAQAKSVYVEPSRILDLQRAKSAAWDLSRLAQLCVELNSANSNANHMTVAILVRAIVDHLPPVFGCTTFAEVANNYAGTKSFKASMQNLDRSLRNIADAHLHTHIRRNEVLPNATQVDFKSDLDVLLAEVVRISS